MRSRVLAVALPAVEAWDGIGFSGRAIQDFSAYALATGMRMIGATDAITMGIHLEAKHVIQAFKHFFAAIITTVAIIVPVILVYPKIAIWIHDGLGVGAQKADDIRGRLLPWLHIAKQKCLEAGRICDFRGVKENTKLLIAALTILGAVATIVYRPTIVKQDYIYTNNFVRTM